MKLTEGLGSEISKYLTGSMKETIDSDLAAALSREIFKVTNPAAAYGAGPLLGVNGISLVGHGRSKQTEIAGAIATAKRAVEVDFINQIQKRLSKTLSTLTENEPDER
jgi:glycerol-3-phosphate acyltransferase PlsX